MSTPETLAAWTLAAAVEAELMSVEAASGASFAGARRPLTDAERVAGVKFSQIADLVDTVAAASRPWVRRLLSTGAELVLNHVFPPGTQTVAAMTAAELTEFGSQLVARAQPVVAELYPRVRDALTGAWEFGAATVLDELTGQGVPGVSAWTVPAAPATIDSLAQSITTHPLLRQLEIASRYVADPFRTLGMQVTRAELSAVLSETSDRSGVDMMHQGLQSVVSLGRTTTVDVNGGGAFLAIYASELLDGASCLNCSLVDGTRYDSLEDAKADYPFGGYRSCKGGARCRGLLVFVRAGASSSSPLVRPG